MRASACLLAVALCMSAMPVSADEWPHDRVGEFRIGDAVEIGKLGSGWELVDGGNRDECVQVYGGTLPAGVGVMLIDGRVARFEVGLSGDPEVDTQPHAPFGLRVGMSLRYAAMRFPDAPLDLDFHKYAWPPGVYLSWLDEKKNRGVRVEVPDDTVTVILWGLADAVTLSEGCV